MDLEAAAAAQTEALTASVLEAVGKAERAAAAAAARGDRGALHAAEAEAAEAEGRAGEHANFFALAAEASRAAARAAARVAGSRGGLKGAKAQMKALAKAAERAQQDLATATAEVANHAKGKAALAQSARDWGAAETAVVELLKAVRSLP